MERLLKDPSLEWKRDVIKALQDSEGAIVLCKDGDYVFLASHGLTNSDTAMLLADLMNRSPAIKIETLWLLADAVVCFSEKINS